MRARPEAGSAVRAAGREGVAYVGPSLAAPRAAPRAVPPASVRPWAPVLAVTLLALLLRLPGLGSGLWADEIYSALWSFRGTLADVLTYYRGDNKHPLYALLANLSAAAFGESAWAWRLPAVLFGVASVPMLHALARRVGSAREALLAAALLAVSYHHVWFSQNARGYALLAFWMLLTTYALLRAVREDRPSLWLLYGTAAALGAYTHLTFVFAVVAQALVAALHLLVLPEGRARGDRRGALAGAALGFALAGALTLLLYAPILSQVIDFFLHKPSDMKAVSSPAWAAGEALRVLRLGLGAGHGLGAVVLAIGGATVLAGVLSYLRSDPTTLLALTLPGAVTIAGALAARGTMYPRFFFFLVGPALMIVVRGAMVMGAGASRLAPRALPGAGGGRAPEALGTAVVAALVVASLASLPRGYRAPKQDFEGAARYIEGARGAGDRVVAIGVTMEPYQAYFRKPWRYLMDVGALRDVRTRGRVWVVYTFPRYLERGVPELMGAIRRDCRVRRTFPGTVGDGDLVVCTMERMPARAPEPA